MTADVAISAVIVTWNSAPVVSGCLESLQRALDGIPSEIIVVDNASADDTIAVVRQTCPEAIVIANSTNVGLAAGNNQGMAQASGAQWLIANPDVVFAPDAVAELRAAAGRHARAGWIVPRFTYEDGSLQTSAGDLPTLGQTLLGRQMARRRAPDGTAGFWWDGWAHDIERRIGRGLESAYLVRADAVADVGPQDEGYTLDWEGLDWTDRFTRAGWEVWLAPTSSVVHLGGHSRRQVPFRAVLTQHRGMYRYFAARSTPALRPVLAVAFTARGAVKMALTALGFPLYSWGHRDRRG